MTRLLFYILFFQTIICFGQVVCDNKTIADLEKKFNKADKKGRSGDYKYADMSFDIAECYRQKKDTSYLKWYRNNLRISKASIKGCDKSIIRSKKLIGQMGYSAFYLGQYQEAITYFQKVIAHQPNSIYNYMLGLCEMKMEHYDYALIEFNNFKKATTDLKDVDDLIGICERKIKP